MKLARILPLALGVTLLMSGCSSSGPNTQLDAAAFQSEITKAGVVVLDVRTPAEFAAGHIIEAKNIDVESADFDRKISVLAKGSTFAVYCHSGRRSAIAVEKMKTAGFTSIFELKDGVLAWQTAGLPLVAV